MKPTVRQILIHTSSYKFNYKLSRLSAWRTRSPGTVSRCESPVVYRCDVCSYGTYSLVPNATDCNICFKNAFCEGGLSIKVPPGFWRSSNESSIVHKCLNPDACLGGLGTKSNGASPCATGYGRNLCDYCEQDD